MIDLYSLVSKTSAYLAVKGDKESDRLSHAYLILTPDGVNLGEYLKIFASLMVCKSTPPCGECRACKLIKEGVYSDVITYPKGEAINSEEVGDLIEESYLKPIEGDKKVFILRSAEKMNAQAQNKLLKTLEEPPKNVYILMGATSEFPLLATIKSRVKKLEIPAFSKEKLFEVLRDDYPDTERLNLAISCSDGTVGNTIALYDDEKLRAISDLAIEVVRDMASSAEVLKYATKILSAKVDLGEFLKVLELIFRDMLVAKESEGLVLNALTYSKIKHINYSVGAILNALEKITEAQKRIKFNANAQMLIEWVLFQILEGKYKWQKL